MNPTPEQQRAINLDRKRLCVDAGAGSGKTRVLIERVLRLIETRKADLDSIVAITFTENAAAEMKARLRKAFRDRGNDARTPDEQTRWRGLERRVESARISTFHAFCMGMSKQYALRFGEDPDFAVLTEAETKLLIDEVIESTLHRLLDHGESAAQRAATEYGVGQLSRMLANMIGNRHLLELHDSSDCYATPETLVARWSVLHAQERNRLLSTFLTRPEAHRLVRGFQAIEGDRKSVV